jgi:3-methyl-2-oxobutanoate hydroxymethyltransferase
VSNVTVLDLRKKKADHDKIVMVTAYDATMGRLVDAAGVDAVLVGDSLGMVIQGEPNTLSVTLDQAVYHTRCVSRGVKRAHLIADMPFMSYQVSPEQAVLNAGRLIQEGGADAVKLEGGERVAESVRRIVDAGIPVMGHLGLTPQSVLAFGGYKVQARGEADQERLAREAKLLESSGCFSLVLEGIPARLGTEVSRALQIPTIGIGAGVGCDGQVLVTHDLLGLFLGHTPKFVRRYAELAATMRGAFETFAADVKARRFPSDKESY